MAWETYRVFFSYYVVSSYNLDFDVYEKSLS